MNKNNLIDETGIGQKYVVKIRGRQASIPFSTKTLAEQHILNLPKEEQNLAEVVIVTDNGKELLFE